MLTALRQKHAEDALAVPIVLLPLAKARAQRPRVSLEECATLSQESQVIRSPWQGLDTKSFSLVAADLMRRLQLDDVLLFDVLGAHQLFGNHAGPREHQQSRAIQIQSAGRHKSAEAAGISERGLAEQLGHTRVRKVPISRDQSYCRFVVVLGLSRHVPDRFVQHDGFQRVTAAFFGTVIDSNVHLARIHLLAQNGPNAAHIHPTVRYESVCFAPAAEIQFADALGQPDLLRCGAFVCRRDKPRRRRSSCRGCKRRRADADAAMRMPSATSSGEN
mmetsp:Transcript_12991/g.37642  ORF Transcript_12991/g.37642 Transcript_12991/m.37642 type:complete len:275 (-) Transcript_12991:89-913(-)